MADLVDRGCEWEQQLREQALTMHKTMHKTGLQTVGNGYCISCQEPIPAPRLKANPNAKRCITCQQDYELKSKQLGIRYV